MAFFKVTFSGRGGTDYGWSETVYLELGNLDQAEAEAAKYQELRRKTIGQGDGAQINRARITLLQANPVVRPVRYAPPATRDNDRKEEMPWTNVLIRVEGPGGHFRILQAHALSDTGILDPWTSKKSSNPVQGAIEVWLARLRNGPYRLKTKSVLSTMRISDIQRDDTGYVLTVDSVVMPAPVYPLHLNRVRTIGHSLKGEVIGHMVDATHLRVNTVVPPLTFIEGSIQWREDAFVPIIRTDRQGLGDRVAGRPFDLLHGRRSKKRR